MKAIVLALLLFSSFAHAERFEPEMLNGALVVGRTVCGRLPCSFVVKDNKLYVIIYDGRLDLQLIYEVVDNTAEEKKLTLGLIWARMLI